MSAGRVVRVEQFGYATLLTLDRPEAMNAVNADLGHALAEADADPTVRVIVVTGAGDRAFCAGADLKAVSRGESISPRDHPEWGFAGFVEHVVSKPVIAAVNGFALGGGTEICLASDLVVASTNAQFGLPEVRRGLLAAAGGAFRLAAQVPKKIAMEWLLTGRAISAQMALEWGLINRVVPPEQLIAAAVDLAAEISANAPLSVQASKRIANHVRDGVIPDEQARWESVQRETRVLMGSQDSIEGPRAFAEKRPPVWIGQ